MPLPTAPPTKVRIGARGSPLAIAQAELFAKILSDATGGAVTHQLITFTTMGDRILDRPLQDAGGKGLFTKELDQAQEDEAIDVAVHSLKDITVHLPEHIYLAAFLPREDPRDCLIGPAATIRDLPRDAVLGTASLRRGAQARSIRPDLKVVTFRGNVQTRLRKLVEGHADATLLAAAGLRRLGMLDQTAGVIEVEEMLPAGGQGIIGVTIRADAPDWLKAACARIDDLPARLAATAERAFLERLDGSCRTPIAAHFRQTEAGAWMAGEVLTDTGDKRWRAEARLSAIVGEPEARALGLRLGDEVAHKRQADLDGDA